MSRRPYQFSTRCVRSGDLWEDTDARNKPIVPAIVQSAIFDLDAVEDAEAIFSGERKGYAYTRFGNPTVEILAKALADLEGGHGALVTSSGNAATLCAVTCAMAGKAAPLVTHPDIYGGSFELLRIFKSVYHMPVEIVDTADESLWLEAVGRAGAVLLETPSNPLMRLIDLKKTVETAHHHGASVIVDNTVATPFNQRPFEFGADWIIHSTTKYLNGHGDVVGGVLLSRKPLTKEHRAIHKNLGGTVNALSAWLTLRGLRTFSLRMETHNRHAAALAEWLAVRPEVTAVHYPGFRNHPQNEIFQRQMAGGGGLLSFELRGGEEAVSRFINHLKLAIHAVSLGEPETLVTLPAKSSHRGMSADDRLKAGISPSLIRLAVGLEALEDVTEDFAQAIAHV